jgi:hypothetical protein
MPGDDFPHRWATAIVETAFVAEAVEDHPAL